MKSSDVMQTIDYAFKVGRPVFIWGAPGVGKSETVRQAADAAGLPLIDVRAVLLDPVDLRGLPIIDNKKATWTPPGFLPSDPESKGVLFLDELNAAPPLVQAACYQLILDRRIGEYELPAGWKIIAAGNRESDKAVVSRMPSALANRFIHIDFDVDVDSWVQWALKNDVKVEVIAFCRFRPELLHNFDPKRNERAFPTPRSWFFASQFLAAGMPDNLLYETLKGTIGEGAAAEFIGFIRIFKKLPSIDAILLSPAGAPVPDADDPATLYAVTSALARKASVQNFGRLVEYFNRLPDEFSVLAISDSYKTCPEVVNTKEFIQWAADHSDVLI